MVKIFLNFSTSTLNEFIPFWIFFSWVFLVYCVCHLVSLFSSFILLFLHSLTSIYIVCATSSHNHALWALRTLNLAILSLATNFSDFQLYFLLFQRVDMVFFKFLHVIFMCATDILEVLGMLNKDSYVRSSLLRHFPPWKITVAQYCWSTHVRFLAEPCGLRCLILFDPCLCDPGFLL
jgi:hypothetical protein